MNLDYYDINEPDLSPITFQEILKSSLDVIFHILCLIIFILVPSSVFAFMEGNPNHYDTYPPPVSDELPFIYGSNSFIIILSIIIAISIILFLYWLINESLKIPPYKE